MTRPLQVYLEEAELERLESWSRSRGWTKSQAIRAAVRAMTRDTREAEGETAKTGKGEKLGKTDALLGASGMIQGLPTDLSSNFDRYLEETFVVPPSPTRARPRQAARARLRR